MKRLERFISVVSSEYSPNYWADEEVEHAIELANRLSASDWSIIATKWTVYDVLVQARIAEVASEIESWVSDIETILIEMLSSRSDDVVEASIDSLNSIAQTDLNRLDPVMLRTRLSRLATPRSPVCNAVLESLIQKLSTT